MATYTVKGNRTAADVIANREETVETGYSLEEARIAANEVQRTREFICAWIEEEEEAATAATLNFAKFQAVVKEAKSKTDDLRWIRAIDRAAEGIINGELIVTVLYHGAQVTSPNGSYFANGSCSCKAFVNGHRECKHRAAGRLMELYEAAPEVKNIPNNIPNKKEPSLGALFFSTAVM